MAARARGASAWARARAYQTTRDPWYLRDAGAQCGSDDAPEPTDRAVAFEAVRRHHGQLRAERYGIPPAASSCSATAAASIGERFAHLAHQAQRDGETFEAAADRVAKRGVAVWFTREGHNGFLKRNNHPLERLGEGADLDWVTAELGLHRAPKPQPRPPVESPPRQPADRRTKLSAIKEFQQALGIGRAA